MTDISGLGHFIFLDVYPDRGIRDWKNSLMRWFIPGYASNQDKKVSQYFIHFFKNAFNDDLEGNPEKFYAMIASAEEHIARGQRWFSHSVSEDIARLEVYIFAARKRMNLFDPGHPRQTLLEKCRTDNDTLYHRWKKLGFDEEAFWTSPDLVDFIFKAHLHRNITYPHYNHTIDMRLCVLRQCGQLVMSKQPHLLVNGQPTPWATLRKTFHIDKEDRVYTIENGIKKYWMYLEEGLTQYDRNNFESPHRLRRLPQTALQNRVEIVTTRAHRETWGIIDAVLKGFRHSFFRIIPGEGFSVRYPKTGLKSGDVYSMGWAPRRRDVTFWAPLSTMKGKWYSPDSWEFAKEDLYATPIDVSDEQLLKLLEMIKKRSQNDHPFHIINANCCGAVVSIFNEAGILNQCPKDHMAYLWYQFLFPKYLRKPIEKAASFASRWIPNCVIKKVEIFSKSVYSIIWAPIFTLLGAWRTDITYEDENGEEMAIKTRNRIKALFSNVFDMFNSNKMVFDLTKNLYKWQKKQPGTYSEKHNRPLA